MGISDMEMGELVVDVVSNPIENVGALSEDSGGVGIGVPGSVSEVAVEKGDCAVVRASVRVPCFQEKIVENVGDGEWFRGFSTPREEAGAKCTQRVLVDMCTYSPKPCPKGAGSGSRQAHNSTWN